MKFFLLLLFYLMVGCTYFNSGYNKSAISGGQFCQNSTDSYLFVGELVEAKEKAVTCKKINTGYCDIDDGCNFSAFENSCKMDEVVIKPSSAIDGELNDILHKDIRFNSYVTTLSKNPLGWTDLVVVFLSCSKTTYKVLYEPIFKTENGFFISGIIFSQKFDFFQNINNYISIDINAEGVELNKMPRNNYFNWAIANGIGEEKKSVYYFKKMIDLEKFKLNPYSKE